MNKILSSPVAAPFLFILAFACYFWGNNAHMYQPNAMAVSFFALIAALAIPFAFCFAIFLGCNRFEQRRAARFILAIALALISVSVLAVFAGDLLRATAPRGSTRRLVRVIVALIPALLYFFRLRGTAKFLNVLFLASVCLSIVKAASEFVEDAWNTHARHERAAVSQIPLVTLKKTPSIYLFWMESFNAPETIDKYYGTTLIQDGFLNRLKERGFQYFGNTYCNTNGTILSMADAFSMKMDPDRPKGVLDTASSTRRMIGGNTENQLLKIMKHNGYFTAFITEGYAYFHQGFRGEFLDSTDYLPSEKMVFTPLAALNHSLINRLTGINDLWGAPQENNTGYSAGTLLERVRHAMHLAKSNDKPLFVSFRGGVQHTESNGTYSWREQEKWLPQYRNLVEKGITATITMLDMILKEDPNAVIVLLGDHGPARLRGIADGIALSNMPAFSALLQSNGESLQSFVDDLFHVIHAIRIPGYERDISQGLAMSQVNVFWHVFAALNDDPALLKNRLPSHTVFRNQTFVIDGKIVSP